MEIDEPAQRRDQDRAFVICKGPAAASYPIWPANDVIDDRRRRKAA